MGVMAPRRAQGYPQGIPRNCGQTAVQESSVKGRCAAPSDGLVNGVTRCSRQVPPRKEGVSKGGPCEALMMFRCGRTAQEAELPKPHEPCRRCGRMIVLTAASPFDISLAGT